MRAQVTEWVVLTKKIKNKKNELRLNLFSIKLSKTDIISVQVSWLYQPRCSTSLAW